MSLNSTPTRSSLFRRGIVALATATTLLSVGLVVAPAAEAAQPPPVIEVHKRQGTTVTTSMYAVGDTINGDPDSQELDTPQFKYLVTLKAQGGTLENGVTTTVTLRKADRELARNTIPVDMKRTSSTGMMHRGSKFLSGAMAPGEYRAGVAISVVVVKPDGTRVRHVIRADSSQEVLFQRDTYVSGAISTQATDGRPARINAVARVLRIADDGTISYERIRSGTAILSFDADGPYGPKHRVVIRNLKIGSDGRIATRVDSRHGFWKITYLGSDSVAESVGWIRQGDHACGC